MIFPGNEPKGMPDHLRTQCYAHPGDFPWSHVTGSVLFVVLQVERVRTILPSQLLCPKYRGKTAAERGVTFKKLTRAPDFFSHEPGGELMPACDYLGYCIYGKVTYEAVLDTSEFVSKITEILKSSVG